MNGHRYAPIDHLERRLRRTACAPRCVRLSDSPLWCGQEMAVAPVRTWKSSSRSNVGRSRLKSSLNGVTGLCMTPLNFVGICSVPVVKESDGGCPNCRLRALRASMRSDCLRPAQAKRSLSPVQTTNAGPNPGSAKGGLRCRMASDRAVRSRLPLLPRRVSQQQGPAPRSVLRPTPRPTRIMRSRTGGNCRRDARGVRPAAWISTPMAPVSGWRSGAARSLRPR